MPAEQTVRKLDSRFQAPPAVSEQVGYAIWDLFFNWSVIFGSAVLHYEYARGSFGALPAWVGSLPTLVIVIAIASRQHALLGLMHEAAHKNLLPGRWNDLVSDVFCAIPLLLVTKFYRTSHLAHHRNVNSAEDPDWSRKAWIFPKRSYFSLWLFIVAESARAVVRRFFIFTSTIFLQPKHSLKFFFYLLGLILFWIFVISMGIGWRSFFLYWVCPMTLILPVLGVVRSVSEHFGLSYKGDLNQSRDIEAGLLERALFGPNALNFHLSHHLFPSVPRYRLKELHRQLKEETWYKSGAKRNFSYFAPSSAPVGSDLIGSANEGLNRN